MTATIVLPLDGSSFGEAALPVAAKVAKEMGARLVLVRAFSLPDAPLRDGSGNIVAYIDQLEVDYRQEAALYLRGVTTALAERYGLTDVVVDVRPGEPVPTIVQAAEEADATLIVMATHGRTGVARVLLGSVAGTVLRRSHIPVTLVRPTTMPSDEESSDRPVLMAVK